MQIRSGTSASTVPGSCEHRKYSFWNRTRTRCPDSEHTSTLPAANPPSLFDCTSTTLPSISSRALLSTPCSTAITGLALLVAHSSASPIARARESVCGIAASPNVAAAKGRKARPATMPIPPTCASVAVNGLLSYMSAQRISLSTNAASLTNGPCAFHPHGSVLPSDSPAALNISRTNGASSAPAPSSPAAPAAPAAPSALLVSMSTFPCASQRAAGSIDCP
mmetsp:Transcript_30910/g.64092  ORF Transcript_30910/g.64092 Transcript_30910/m.64092 type:complete len:222 (+) Transcript_30910:342-1007(+)